MVPSLAHFAQITTSIIMFLLVLLKGHVLFLLTKCFWFILRYSCFLTSVFLDSVIPSPCAFHLARSPLPNIFWILFADRKRFCVLYGSRLNRVILYLCLNYLFSSYRLALIVLIQTPHHISISYVNPDAKCSILNEDV